MRRLILPLTALACCLSAPAAQAQDLAQRLRADEVTEVDRRDAFQAIAPDTEKGLYLVPQVME